MPLSSGKLNNLVTIERRISAIDSSGDQSVEWTYVTTVWACITDLSSAEILYAQQIQSKVTSRVIIRYRNDVDATCRLQSNGVFYNVLGVIGDPVTGREFLTLQVSAGTNEG